MRAAWYSTNGKAGEVLVVGELQPPTPGAGEVRVKLATSGVNPSDVKSRAGRPFAYERIVPHSDGAGVIDAVGEGVSSTRISERVWVWNGQWQRPFGTAAEFIVVPENQAVPLPSTIDFAAGACLGIPAMTAFQAVRLLGDLAGRSVLVIGASSAVGHYATQFAVRRGATVIGTVGSEAKARHAHTAGAHHTINYKHEPVAERIQAFTNGRGVDAIVDMDFSSTVQLLAQGSLVEHGTIVTYGSNAYEAVTIPYKAMLWNSVNLHFFLVYSLSDPDRQAVLQGLGTALTDPSLIHTVGASYPLEDIAEAHEAVEGGKLIGNVVVNII